MKIFSAFDGIACARIALERAKIDIEVYYASEIDRYAMEVAKGHYPYYVNLGDIRAVNPNLLPKIDLMIGGFPCQSFSVAGDRLEFGDKRGRLFFDMMYIFDRVRPTYFLFENVKMKNSTRDLISKRIGVDAVEINSNQFSAQNRKRLYWTNIPILDIHNAQIYLSDILDPSMIGESPVNFKLKRPLKANINEFGVLVEQRTESAKKERRENLANGVDYCSRSDKEYVVRKDNKANAVLTSPDENILFSNGLLRRLTPLEAERLQTIPDHYTSRLSDSQRYKAIGNGFTVDVIAHILRGIKNA